MQRAAIFSSRNFSVGLFGSGYVLTNEASSPAFGTPAFTVFNGFVDFVGEPNPSIELGNTASVTYFFSGLDPASEYNFQATAIRGEPTYTNRWSLFQISGARAFTNADQLIALDPRTDCQKRH